jgi:CelD/BcsL family acetyltransferase involved in cellulose biosynthesis
VLRRAIPSLRIEIVDTSDGLEALSAQWAALEALTPEATGFQSFGWCQRWIDVSQAGGMRCRARVVTVREGGVLVMLWPLQIERRLGVSLVRWLGEPITQYGDALALPGVDRPRWCAAVQAEFRRWRDVDLFALARMRMDSALVGSGLPTWPDRDGLSAPFVDLSPAALATRRRHKSVERRTRRLATYGAPVFEEVVDPAQRLQAVREALKLKRRWLREKGKFSAGLGASVAAHFIENLARSGFLRIHCLRIGETIAAIDLGFVAGASFRSFLGAFDERFAAGSPGLALLPHLIERCAGEGLARFDFLPPADPYKQIWATDATPLRAHYAPVTLRGRAAALALERARPMAKRFLAGESLKHGFAGQGISYAVEKLRNVW